jgi:hypothetical protein
MKRLLIFILVLSSTILAFSQDKDIVFQWTEAKDLGVGGKGWVSDSLDYYRLPLHARGHVPAGVWDLSKHTAGFYLHFITDARTIKAKWGLTDKELELVHFAATGKSGLDLYVRMKDNSWHWLGIGRPKAMENEEILIDNMQDGKREYLLYFPLYNGITHLEIGIPVESKLEKAPSFPGKSIVFYGTSIIQGGCASRPGMCSAAIIERKLNRDIINLGFSGKGRMEPEMAELMSELDPALYFIDCMPNMEAKEIEARVEPFIRILRKAHPETPIVLAEGVIYNDAFLVKNRQEKNEMNNKALRNAYENLLTTGFKNIYYQISEGVLGSDGEGTVDGTHPTDLGFTRQAAAYKLMLRRILNQ